MKLINDLLGKPQSEKLESNWVLQRVPSISRTLIEGWRTLDVPPRGSKAEVFAKRREGPVWMLAPYLCLRGLPFPSLANASLATWPSNRPVFNKATMASSVVLG